MRADNLNNLNPQTDMQTINLNLPPTSAPRVQRGHLTDASNRTSTGRADVSPRPPALSPDRELSQLAARDTARPLRVETTRAPSDPELAMQETGGRLNTAFAWLVFHAVVIWAGAHAWLTLKRQCAWCRCRLGGNPLSRNVTHGICPACRKRFLAAAGIKS